MVTPPVGVELGFWQLFAIITAGVAAGGVIVKQLWDAGKTLVEIKNNSDAMGEIAKMTSATAQITRDNQSHLEQLSNSLDLMATTSTVTELRKQVWMDGVTVDLAKLRDLEMRVDGILSFRRDWLARQDADMVAIHATLDRLTHKENAP